MTSPPPPVSAGSLSAPISLGLAGLVALALLPPEAGFLAGLAAALWLGISIAVARRRVSAAGRAR
ncbi:hypothetical protein [Siccirubricoccus phaeus]|uniref:hypothetical protein n=1 Tax=Siccirubricoccus phaeus TaxID=2595053 RepID=UPI0011F108BD|nr:hypothetical protein [Siccirubricoccus phaeus]